MRVCAEWLSADYLARLAARDRDAGVVPRVTVLPPRCGHDPADCPPIPARELEEAS